MKRKYSNHISKKAKRKAGRGTGLPQNQSRVLSKIIIRLVK